jgi:hypothetical protein
MENITNPYEFLDFGIEDSKAAEEKIASQGRSDRDKRICACGHPMARHWTEHGKTLCKPSKMECPCRFESHRAVLLAGDARKFLRKTEGPGPEHALARGILASIESGSDVEWLVEMVCDFCGEQSQLSPVPVTSSRSVEFKATGYDALLCRKCRGL